MRQQFQLVLSRREHGFIPNRSRAIAVRDAARDAVRGSGDRRLGSEDWEAEAVQQAVLERVVNRRNVPARVKDVRGGESNCEKDSHET